MPIRAHTHKYSQKDRFILHEMTLNFRFWTLFVRINREENGIVWFFSSIFIVCAIDFSSNSVWI